jgi:uncharacterized protein
MDFGLNDKTINILKEFFSNYSQLDEVKIYGSRAKGDFKKGSDIDFAIYGNIDFKLLRNICSKLEELPIPYKFDVTDYKTIENSKLKEHIDRIGKHFYKKGEKIE